MTDCYWKGTVPELDVHTLLYLSTYSGENLSIKVRLMWTRSSSVDLSVEPRRDALIDGGGVQGYEDFLEKKEYIITCKYLTG